MIAVGRRQVLGWLVCGAGACALGCGVQDPEVDAGPPADAGPAKRFAQVTLSALPVGSFVLLNAAGCGTAAGCLVGRDEEGVYAFTSVCTHQGGTVQIPGADGHARCCLHGATYDRNGDVVKGIVPGQASLKHLKVELQGEGNEAEIVVSLDSEELDRGFRLQV